MRSDVDIRVIGLMLPESFVAEDMLKMIYTSFFWNTLLLDDLDGVGVLLFAYLSLIFFQNTDPAIPIKFPY